MITFQRADLRAANAQMSLGLPQCPSQVSAPQEAIRKTWSSPGYLRPRRESVFSLPSGLKQGSVVLTWGSDLLMPVFHPVTNEGLAFMRGGPCLLCSFVGAPEVGMCAALFSLMPTCFRASEAQTQLNAKGVKEISKSQCWEGPRQFSSPAPVRCANLPPGLAWSLSEPPVQCVGSSEGSWGL